MFLLSFRTGKHATLSAVAVVEERHRREHALLRRAASHDSLGAAVEQLVGDFIGVLGSAEERA